MENSNHIVQAIQNNQLVAVFDGSYQSEIERGSVAWIMETTYIKNSLGGKCISPGTNDHQSATAIEQLTPDQFSFPTAQYKGKTIFDNVKEKVYQAITDEKLINHWIKKEQFPRDQLPNIDWESKEKAMKLAGMTRSQFVSKWVSGYVATGKNMKRWQMRPHGYCPFCKEEEETVYHILHYQHDDAQMISKEAMEKFLQQMLKIGI